MSGIGIAISPDLLTPTPAEAGFDADAEIWWAEMVVQPSDARKTLDSNLFKALKAAGLWAGWDCLWFLAHETEQGAFLNARQRAHDITKTGGVTFTADRGVTGDGTTGHLDTNYAPGTHGVNFLADDATYFIYSRTNSAGNFTSIGCQQATTQRAYLSIRLGTNVAVPNCNNGSGGVSPAVTDSSGLFSVTRILHDARLWRNGVDISGNLGKATTSRPAVNAAICAFNSNGTIVNRSTRQYAAVGFGAALSDAEQLTFFNLLEGYLDAIGAGVV